MTSRRGGRPSRENEVDEVMRIAGASRESVRNFFHRPGRLSPEMRQRIAGAVAQTGYRPIRRAHGSLSGVAVGYQMPKFWSEPSPVMLEQFHELLEAAQTADAHLVPFVVDPRVEGVDGVVGGTSDEQATAKGGLQGFYRQYANAMAPHLYRDMMHKRQVQMFVVNDLAVDDPRLRMLKEEGVPYVALGFPRSESGDARDSDHPFVETDNRSAIIAMAGMLRESGCRTFGHVGFSDDASHVTQDRRDAVNEAVGRVPAFPISYLDSLDPDDPTHRAALAEWLRAHDVDAVLCDSDALAYMVHRAADLADRSVVQDPILLHAARRRTLMLTGNDNSLHRRRVATEQRWMTMSPPERAKMQATITLLSHLREHGPDTVVAGVLIPPRIILWADRGEGHPAKPGSGGIASYDFVVND